MKAILAAAVILFAFACSSPQTPPPRALAPADDAGKARVLAAWDEAVRRADSLAPSRILYDAKFGKGAVRLPGNLAVVAGRGSLSAKASGPLGGEVGNYQDGTFTGKSGELAFLDPELLRGLLAGVWRTGTPSVEGVDSEQGLLRWETAGVIAEGVLDLSDARLRSLRVRGDRGEVSAEFSGAFDPWPEIVLLTDQKSGRSLKLRRIVVEAIACP